MFSRAGILRRFWYKFGDDNLSNQLKMIFGEKTTLGSDKLQSLLMIILRNATTIRPGRSATIPWPSTTIPRSRTAI